VLVEGGQALSGLEFHLHGPPAASCPDQDGNDQHPVRLTQVLGHIAAHIIADAIGVPARPRQQMLYLGRARIPRVLGDAPAVGPRQPGQHPEHERPRPPPRLDPAETTPDPQHRVFENAQPPAGVYAVASGHRQKVMRRHKP
jgi:hypothetical protein